MSTRPNGAPLPDTDKILADFFAEEAPPYEPPVLLPALLARTALARRRPAWRIPSWWLPASIAWRPRTPGRSNTMFSVMRIATAGAILALVTGSLITTLTFSPSPGGLTPSPTASPVVLTAGTNLEAGTTYAISDPCCLPGRLLLTVPAPGWFTIDTWFLGKNVIDPQKEGYDITLLPELVGNLHADPCHWRNSALNPPVGPAVDDLAIALMAQPAQNASAVSDVTLGGYAGKKVEMSIPDGLVPSTTCDDGDYGRWYGDSDPSGYQPFTYGKGQLDTVYIIDVDGTRWVIDTNHLPGTSDADLAELQQILDSIRFELPAASPSPSP